MVSLKAEKIDIEDKKTVSGKWYTFVDFYLSEKKPILGIFSRRKLYDGDKILLMVCDTAISSKPSDPDITQEEFDKRLSITEYDKNAIVAYIEKRVKEASEKASINEAYSYLKQYFIVDDYYSSENT